MLLATAVARAQAPTWQLAVAATGGTSEVFATAADASGNVFLTGTFSGTVGFGGMSLTSTGRNDNDVFVAKWSGVTNRFVWVQRAGGVGNDSSPTIAVSGTSIYIAGRFAGTASFGTTVLTAVGSDDGFVAKLTDAGTTGAFGWAFGIGGRDSEQATAIAATGSSVYVGGSFYSPTVGFGSISLTNFSAAAPLQSDGFVAKLTDAGTTASFVWVQQVGGSGDDHVVALASTANGVYVTGNFSNTASFGATMLTGGNLAAFVAKLTDTPVPNRFVWAVGTSGGAVFPNAVAVSGPNVYVAGRFVFTTSFGPTALTSTGTQGGYDVFVTKIADAGTTAGFTWAVQAGGAQSDFATAIAASGSSLYVAGVFLGPSSFGSGSLTSFASSDDAFLAKLTDAGPTGSFAWATAAGGSGADQANGLALSGSTIYVAGPVMPPASFGPLALASPGGASVSFLASLADPTLTGTTSGHYLESLHLFPNPAHGRATVQLPAGIGPATLTVLDALGRVMRTQTTINGPKTEIDLTGLAPGLYAVRMAAGGGAATQKLVVE
ncbi:T9SS type A sorting domain-containing protein [Hymenobacter negativus]|uniref:T9SS type A sorting domain-containing protein n=1 Tax=Hymenobacter negativus TaxID=2795026 RepID=A0ABS3QMF1_9BACT|nr:T9SS type A sorting domain-containing protein [Hymenobacter negativus]MBO2012436.1 T9SS type A sorting domain-containing protein [Hymenobacter negativus]